MKKSTEWIEMLYHTFALKQIGVAALYALLRYVGELYFEGDAIVGYLEPASGLALAALLIGGRRYAWGVFIGALLINATSDNSIWVSVTIALGDTLQAFCGAWLLTRKGKFDVRLQSLRDYLRLLLLGGGMSIAIGAMAVNTALLFSGLLTSKDYFYSLIQWWMSDTLGVILIAPLILVWWRAKNDWREVGQKIEAALLLGLTVLFGQIVFLDWLHDSIGQVAKGYWMFLLATWVAVRLGIRGTVIALLVVAVQALLGAIRGTGFFAADIAQTHLANYWLYMLTLSAVSMALATHFTERKLAENETKEAQERFEMIFNATPDIAVISRLQDGCITNVNDAFTEFSGHPMGEAIGSSTIGLNLWVNHGDREKFINELRTKGICENLEARFQSKDGKQHTGLLSAKITFLQGIQHIISITRDITERKQTEDKLAESELRLRAVAQSANDAIITAVGVGNIMDWNAAAERLFGYTKAEINGQPLTVLMPERFRNLHSEGLARVDSGGAPRIIGKTVEVAGLRKDGSEFPLELSLAQWQAADGQFFTAILRDITERKQAEEQIRTLAFYDALTQLPNRRLLNDRLEQTMAASKRCGHYGALMFLDLDNFKPLNDTHGHGVGDLLLIEVAHRLTGCVREVDTVARFGGDEFVVMLGELDADKAKSTAQARIVAEKIRSTLAEPYLLILTQESNAEKTVEHRCAASIGVVVFNSEASAEDILKWADTAMYQAKEGGRNMVRFSDAVNSS